MQATQWQPGISAPELPGLRRVQPVARPSGPWKLTTQLLPGSKLAARKRSAAKLQHVQQSVAGDGRAGLESISVGDGTLSAASMNSARPSGRRRNSVRSALNEMMHSKQGQQSSAMPRAGRHTPSAAALAALEQTASVRKQRALHERIRPKATAAFSGAGRGSYDVQGQAARAAHSVASGPGGGSHTLVRAARQGANYAHSVVKEAFDEMERDLRRAAEEAAAAARVKPKASAEQDDGGAVLQSNTENRLDAWRARLANGPVQAARGRRRLRAKHQRIAGPDTQNMLRALRRNPNAYAVIGDADTMKGMLQMVDANVAMLGKRHQALAKLSTTLDTVHGMWTVKRTAQELTNATSAERWSEKWKVPLRSTHAVVLSLNITPAQRAAQQAQEHLERKHRWQGVVDEAHATPRAISTAVQHAKAELLRDKQRRRVLLGEA